MTIVATFIRSTAFSTLYESEDAALQRVEYLKGFGIWPGIRNNGLFWWLTYDPMWTKQPWE